MIDLYYYYNQPSELFQYETARPNLFFEDQEAIEHFGKGEDFIAKDPFLAMQYAKNVIKGEWKKGEKAISRTAESAYYYAALVLEDEFPEGEDAIGRSAYFSFGYAQSVKKGRFPKGEKAIATDGEKSLRYARDVIKDEFPEGEEVMKKTSTGFKTRTYYDVYQHFLDFLTQKKKTDDEMNSILNDAPLGLL